MIDLLKKNGKFYKANLHCHTIISDGQMTPEQVKDYYKKAGYSIVAYTDHNKYITHEDLKDSDFLPVAGFEADFHTYDSEGKKTRVRTCHINFYPENPDTAIQLKEPKIYDVDIINKYISDMKKNGWICALNHPTWSLQPTEDVCKICGITAMEIYNNGCEKLYNNGYSYSHYFQYLHVGKRAFAVATDDNHCGLDENGKILARDDTLNGFIYISMPELSHQAFIKAYKEGSFYPSTGAEFKELYIDEENDELVVRCSPVKSVVVRGGRYCFEAEKFSTKDDITEVRFCYSKIIKNSRKYFRVEIRTSDDKIAFSQPYYF